MNSTTWPRFHWSAKALTESLASVRHEQGRLIGHMQALGFNLRQEIVLETLITDVLKSSEIEGVNLDTERAQSNAINREELDIQL